MHFSQTILIREAISEVFEGASSDFVAKIANNIVKRMDHGVSLHGLMKDGTAVKIRWVDRGDLIPGVDKNGNRFEAYTTYLRIYDESVGERSGLISETYVQVDRDRAERSGDGEALRRVQEMEALDKMGLNVGSVTLNGRPFFNGHFLEMSACLTEEKLISFNEFVDILAAQKGRECAALIVEGMNEYYIRESQNNTTFACDMLAEKVIAFWKKLNKDEPFTAALVELKFGKTTPSG